MRRPYLGTYDDLFDDLLRRPGDCALMLKAYFDESERTKGVFSVAGFAYRRADAKRCGREWMKLFGSYGGCHMTDLANRRKAFKGISDSEAERLIHAAVAIINRRAIYGVAVSCHVDEMISLLPTWIDGFQGAYPVCCHAAMMTLGNLIRATGPIERVHYFFESGHDLQAAAHHFMGRVSDVQILKESYLHGSDSFVPKEEMPQLQTADILAWEWAKYWDETVIEGKRLMRKSLVAMLTHGSKNPANFNAERVKFVHLTGLPLRRFAKQVADLGLSQIRESHAGAL